MMQQRIRELTSLFKSENWSFLIIFLKVIKLYVLEIEHILLNPSRVEECFVEDISRDLKEHSRWNKS